MKVAIITPEFLPNWGGIGTYAAQLAKHLPDDFEVHIISLSRDKKGEKQESLPGITDRITLHTLGKARDTFLYNSQFQVNLLRDFKSLQAKHGFDVLHANHAQMPDLFLKLFRHDVPSITTVHTTIISQRAGTKRADLGLRHVERSEKMTYLLFPALSMAERAYLRRCRNIIFVSRYIRDLFEATFGPPEHSRIIHNGVDTSVFRPRAREECLEHFPALDGLDNVILFSGRMIALKGLDTAIAAFSRIIREFDAHLVMAGVGNFDPWRRMLQDNGVPESRYVFLEQVPYQEMPYLYPLASTFMLPSYSESFPMTILEAMSSGLAVVASRVGGIPEMISDQRDGCLFEPGNPLALAEALTRLLSDRATAERIGKNARTRAMDEFSAVKMAATTSEVYREVAGGSA
ncbi:MAG: glycosyltransferase family 4 protein [Methanomassiliicoccales archaeon]|nr:glycosyltransferase family 4 protein [Methanomassiliicoccales archaeon]